MFRLSQEYYEGLDVNKDLDLARFWGFLAFSAIDIPETFEANAKTIMDGSLDRYQNAVAMKTHLFETYLKDTDLKPTDIFKAAADKGEAHAKFYLAYDLFSNNHEGWLDLLISAAEESSYMANSRLGKYYSTGSIFGSEDKNAVDAQKAFKYLEKAAEMGDDNAMVLLSHNYRIGCLVERDESKADSLLFQASNLGNNSARLRIAELNYDKDLALTNLYIMLWETMQRQG